MSVIQLLIADIESECCTYVNYVMCRSADFVCNIFQSKGSLLNTNTIDAFKNSDKKKLLQPLTEKVCIILLTITSFEFHRVRIIAWTILNFVLYFCFCVCVCLFFVVVS